MIARPGTLVRLACVGTCLAFAVSLSAGVMPLRQTSGEHWAIIAIAPELMEPAGEPGRLAEVLVEGYGYRPEHIAGLYGEAAGVEGIRAAFDEILGRNVPPDSLLVVIDATVSPVEANGIQVAGSSPEQPWTLLQAYEIAGVIGGYGAVNFFVVMPSCDPERTRTGTGSIYAGRTFLYHCPRKLDARGIRISVAAELAGTLSDLLEKQAVLSSKEAAEAFVARLPFPVATVSVPGASEFRFTPRASRVIPFVLAARDATAAVQSRLEAIELIASGVRAEKGGEAGIAPDPSAARTLLDIASDSDEVSALRVRAIWALGEIQDQAAVEPMRRIYEETADADLRRAIVEALPRVGAANGREFLIAALSDPAAIVRGAALGNLGRVSADDAVPAAIAALSDRSADVVITALQILGATEAELDSSVDETLAALSDHRVAAVRRELIATWASLGRSPTGLLVDAFQSDPDPTVRSAAVYALARNTIPREFARSIENGLLEALGAGEPWMVRDAAIWALGEQRVSRASRALRAIAASADESPLLRTSAIEALGKLKDFAAVTLLIELLPTGPEEVRRAAAMALGTIGNPTAVGALARAAEDPVTRREATAALQAIQPSADELRKLLAAEDPRVRLDAALKLVQNHPGQARHALALLGDPIQSVRETVAAALGSREPTPSLRREVRQMLETGDPRLRAGAVELLARWGERDDLERILALRSDPHPDVRAAVIRALARRNERESPELIADALADGHPTVRLAGLMAIDEGSLDSETYLAALRRLADDPVPDVRQAAIEMLRERGKK